LYWARSAAHHGLLFCRGSWGQHAPKQENYHKEGLRAQEQFFKALVAEKDDRRVLETQLYTSLIAEKDARIRAVEELNAAYKQLASQRST
jgi:UDP-3-O-acyl-N-acetylglucosamine deacetylase